MRFILAVILILFSWCATSSAQDITGDLRSKIKSFQEKRETIRNELIVKFQENSGASREKKSQLVMAWRTQNTDRIKEFKQLGQEIFVQLRKKVLTKYTELEHLPPEESEIAIQQWYSDNDITMTAIGTTDTLEKIKVAFRQEAREKFTAMRSEFKNIQQANKQHVSNNSRASVNRGGNSGGTGKDKGKDKGKKK